MLIASVSRRHPSRCLKALWRKQCAPRRLNRAAPCITPSSSVPSSYAHASRLHSVRRTCAQSSGCEISSPASSRLAPRSDTATAPLRSVDSARTSSAPPLSKILPPLFNVHVGISTMQPTPTSYTRRRNTSTLRNARRKTRRGAACASAGAAFRRLMHQHLPEDTTLRVCTRGTTQHLRECNARRPPSTTASRQLRRILNESQCVHEDQQHPPLRGPTFAPRPAHCRWTCAGNSDVPNAPPRAQVVRRRCTVLTLLSPMRWAGRTTNAARRYNSTSPAAERRRPTDCDAPRRTQARRRAARQDGGVVCCQGRRALQDTRPRTFALASKKHQRGGIHDVPTSNRPASDVRLVIKSR
ncbi:hypothetical protein BDW22DRAFT_1364682 [Trametopsis cervina]|nr:hypothetical protein BDW22DRAFT_1364682 [Trametopsis cervina]